VTSETAKKWTGPEDDVPGVLRAAALAAGVSDVPTDAPHPHGREGRAYRLGPTITLWKDTSLHYDANIPAWILEHRLEGKVVPARYTHRALYDAAAEAVSLLVRDRVLAVLEGSFGNTGTRQKR